jgi:mannose-6-phosphate isomerase-like protein (cupin superfamily)
MEARMAAQNGNEGSIIKDASNKMTLAYSTLEDMKFNPGRRSWIKYRDLGVSAGSHGAMSGTIMHIDDASTSKPTGWHYHTASMQFNYIVEGWVKFEFPDLGVITVKAGESIMIPGGTVHQELCSSEPLRLLEIFVPAAFDTVAVTDPEWSKEKAQDYGEVEPVNPT